LIFQLYHPTKGTFVISEEAIASSPLLLRGKRLLRQFKKAPSWGSQLVGS